MKIDVPWMAWFMAVGVTAAAFAVGLSLGDSEDDPAPITTVPAGLTARSGPQTRKRESVREELHPTASVVDQVDSSEDAPPEEDPLSEAELEDTLAEVGEEEEEDPEIAEDERVIRKAMDLVERIVEEPEALHEVLAAFRREQNPARLLFLADVLAEIGSADTDALALEIAQGDVDPERRAIAFDLLQRLATPGAVPVALRAMTGDADPRVRAAAVTALPEPKGWGRREAGTVINALHQALGDADSKVRVEAALKLADWRRDEADLAPLLRLVAEDTDPEARAMAVRALEISRARSPDIQRALAKILADPEEDPLLRENACHALIGAAPLVREVAETLEQHREAFGPTE